MAVTTLRPNLQSANISYSMQKRLLFKIDYVCKIPWRGGGGAGSFLAGSLIIYYLGSENKGADQTARIRGLFCAFVVRIWQNRFSHDVAHLRNKFHFSEVHESINATGHAQNKWRPSGVTLTLHSTRCVHTSMNLRKMKFISYIYTLFLHRFCSLLVES